MAGRERRTRKSSTKFDKEGTMVGTTERANRLSTGFLRGLHGTCTGLVQGVEQEAVAFVSRRGCTSMLSRQSRGVRAVRSFRGSLDASTTRRCGGDSSPTSVIRRANTERSARRWMRIVLRAIEDFDESPFTVADSGSNSGRPRATSCS